VQLVRRRDEPYGRRSLRYVSDISLLARPPIGFWVLVGIRAAVHDPRHLVPVACPDVFQTIFAAPVLRGIMQEGGDHFVLRAVVLSNDSRYGQEVGDVGDAGAFARLVSMQPGGVDQSVFELLSIGQGGSAVLCE
jgi:hypothetical protein